jgi:hypothetical protein
MLLTTGIGVAVPGSVATAAAPAPSSSEDLSPATLVLRGSTAVASQLSAVNDGATVVLRGSPPPVAGPRADAHPCLPDYDYAPSYGCVLPGYAYPPNDYGYWPDYGFDGFFSSGRRRRFSHGLAHGAGRGAPVRFAQHPARGFSHPFAGFGRR